LYGALGYTNQYLSVDDLQSEVVVENETIQIQRLENVIHLLKDGDNDIALQNSYSSASDKGHGMLCIISGVSFAIIWGNSSVYLFDPHSRDNKGQVRDNGSSMLLEFLTLRYVENYIKEIYVPREQEMYLETQYFRIVTNKQITDKIRLSIGKKRKRDRNRKYGDSIQGRAKIRENVNKYQKTKKGRTKNRESLNRYKNTKQGKTKEKASSDKHNKNKEQNDFTRKIKEFKRCIKNGPFYICVICNRSLYKRSLKIFRKIDYTGISEEHFLSRVETFDGKEYILYNLSFET